LTIINNLAASIAYNRVNDTNSVTVLMKKS
jgi:hypothetical protein